MAAFQIWTETKFCEERHIAMRRRDRISLHASKKINTVNIYSASTCHLRIVRTRGSPFSLRLRSFSCRLLSVFFSSVDTSEFSDDRPIMGPMKLVQSLNNAYDGILGTSVFPPSKTESKAYQQVKAPKPFTKRAASDLTRPYMYR